MSDSQIHTSELDKWSVVTRFCSSLEQAEVFAQEFLHKTSHIVLWPLKPEKWMLIVRLPILWN
jgi:hypothetical protein